MNAGLREKIETIRGLLEEEPDSFLFANFAPGFAGDRGELSELPEGLAELLALANGIWASAVNIICFENIPRGDFMMDCDPVPRGSERFLCFAMGAEFPLGMDRSTGTVWWFPDLDAEDYFFAERFEHLTDDVDQFVDYYVLGEGYRTFSGGYSGCLWDQFLTRHGYLSPPTG
jgi:hypothetical protein